MGLRSSVVTPCSRASSTQAPLNSLTMAMAMATTTLPSAVLRLSGECGSTGSSSLASSHCKCGRSSSALLGTPILRVQRESRALPHRGPVQPRALKYEYKSSQNPGDLTQGKGRRSVICQSTNGKPLRGDMNGDTFPAFESFGGDIKPLGQGWDPWKQSGEARNTEGEISGRDEVLRKVGNNKYGVVGNEGDEPFRIMADGKKAYLDELDVLTLLAPPPFLKPMSTMNNYNHAAFLWKKIAAIPEERRHRLLDLLEPRHITAMWKMAELRYQDPGLYLQNASQFLHSPASKPLQPIIWRGQVNDVPWIFSFLSRFKKAFFYSEDRELYGRVITGGSFLEGLGNIVAPLYFHVKPIKSVLATNEQCDFAFSYDTGHLELKNAVPNAFPQPGKHPSPFGKEFFDYVRVVGPGVVVGQSWHGSFPEKQDPKKPGVGPRKYLGEFVLIQNYENQIL